MSPLVLLLLACTGGDKTSQDTTEGPDPDPATVPGLRLAADAWARLDGDDDPYRVEGDDEVECSPLGWKSESGFFEIESDYCAKATWAQPLLGDVAAGDTLEFVFWHLDLWADPPYRATLEMAIEGEAIWHYEVDVPSSENVLQVEVLVPVSVAEGATATLHLDNHGVNSWRVGEVSLVAAEP